MFDYTIQEVLEYKGYVKLANILNGQFAKSAEVHWMTLFLSIEVDKRRYYQTLISQSEVNSPSK